MAAGGLSRVRLLTLVAGTTAQSNWERVFPALCSLPRGTEPFAGLAFVHLNTDSFAESGSTNIAALSGLGSDEDVGYSTL